MRQSTDVKEVFVRYDYYLRQKRPTFAQTPKPTLPVTQAFAQADFPYPLIGAFIGAAASSRSANVHRRP